MSFSGNSWSPSHSTVSFQADKIYSYLEGIKIYSWTNFLKVIYESTGASVKHLPKQGKTPMHKLHSESNSFAYGNLNPRISPTPERLLLYTTETGAHCQNVRKDMCPGESA